MTNSNELYILGGDRSDQPSNANLNGEITQTVERCQFSVVEDELKFTTVNSPSISEFFNTHPYSIWKGYSHA